MPLDPQIAPLVEATNAAAAKLPSIWDQSVEDRRAGYQALADLAGPGPQLDRVEDLHIAGVPCRIYENDDANGILMFIHGGGYVIGDLETHDQPCRQLALESGAAVVAVDYRLAPEHPFPAGLDDAWAVFQALYKDRNNFGRGSKLAVTGDSAGGNLTLSLLNWIRDNQRAAPNAALALSPITDGRFTSPSIRSNLETDVMLKPLAKRVSWLPGFLLGLGARVMGGRGASNPVISPLLADLSGLPPILVQCSDCEILRDDGRRYVNKAVEAGTNAILQRWDNVPHVWPIFHPELPEAAEAFAEIEAFFKRHS